MHAKGRFQKMKCLMRIMVIRAKLPSIPVRGRYLHPHTLRVSQFKKTAKAYVSYTDIRIGPAEVIDDDIHAGVQKRLDDVLQPRNFHMHFDMLSEIADMGERLRAHPSVERLIGMSDQVQPNPCNARIRHLRQCVDPTITLDHRDTA